jgi:ceramide glucosyltransferase
MMHAIVRMVEGVALLGVVSSSLYYLLCLRAAAIFRRDSTQTNASSAAAGPPVSILKPLKGADPDMYESFRSHCLQNYPQYEIIFGVSDPEDPAIEIVKRLQGEFSGYPIRLMVCPELLGTNVKVSNLAQMLPEARYEHLIVNDSDIRVEPDYLRRIMSPLADSRIGMVTCLYRGVAGNTLGSRLESVGISTDFCPSVLAARQLEGGIRFGLGSTLAFRRAELEKTGGFISIVDDLADDYELGKRIANLGLKVELSDVVVETFLPAYGMSDFLAHQLRWARGVRGVRGRGYIGLIFTFGFLWALLALFASRGEGWVWFAAAVVLLLRFAVAFLVGGTILGDRQTSQNIWLIPLRDLIAVGVWLASFVGRAVTWRGSRFNLRDGKLTRILP